MTPTEQVLSSANKTVELKDGRGRSICVRRLTALDTLRLLKAAGPALAQNQPWLTMAMLAVAVNEIDHVPVPTPVSEAQIEALVERLGEDGMEAIADTFDRWEDAEPLVTGTAVGN